MNKKLRQVVQQEIRNAIREEMLTELGNIAERITKKSNLLKEADEMLPTQKDAENIEIMAGDVQKIIGILSTLYKDAAEAQRENETPSPYMDAYTKLLLAMLPITSALKNSGVLGGALKQGKLSLGGGSQYNLGTSISAPKKTPPPPPPMPPKINVPPAKKLPPPVPPKKQGPPPPPTRKPGTPPPPPKRQGPPPPPTNR